MSKVFFKVNENGIDIHMLLDAFFLDLPDCEDHVNGAMPYLNPH